jgi:hypothetical protein
MLAIFTRSSAIAIGIGIEFLARGGESPSWLPAPPSTSRAARSARLQGGTDGFPWGAALRALALYGAIAAAVSLIVFRAGDIVS